MESQSLYRYTFWPGAYSFKNEISLFIIMLRDKLDDLLKSIEKTEKEISQHSC